MISVLSALLIAVGLFFFLGAAVGLIRFPDFFTRAHAAGKGDTLSTLLILLGLGIYTLREFPELTDIESWSDLAGFLLFLKILAICAFIGLTSPTSTHALLQAGYDEGIKPYTAEGDSGEEDRT